MRLRTSENAAGDLEEIFDYWAERAGVQTANRLLDKIGERFSLLTRYPRAGVARTEFGPGIRRVAAGSYVVYYRTAQHHVEILRVLHGARDQRNAFSTQGKRT